MAAIKLPTPTEIVCKVAHCDAVKEAYPGFKSAAIGVDVLHVVDPGDYPDACGQIDRAMGDVNSD